MIADKHHIGPDCPVLTVAEAGINHNGDMELAHRLVDLAADAKVDALKIQTIHAAGMLREDTPKAPYQAELTGVEETQYAMLQATELNLAQHRELKAHCEERNLLFMSTPFDFRAVDLLRELGVEVYKIPSGEITHLQLLRYIAGQGKPVILSTGMSRLGEVERGLDTLRESGCHSVALLHCISNYPTDPADVNLRAMETMSCAFDVPVGFSDHTSGTAVSVAAAALGACIIEKHFTVDKGMAGPDHKASLDPDELGDWVVGIREVQLAMGSGKKEPVAAEEGTRLVIRRSLHASRDVAKDSLLSPDTIVALRPEGGIPPEHVDLVVGRRAGRDLSAGECLQWSDLT